MNFTLHGLFNRVALEYFEKYTKSKKLFMELTNNNQSWDILSHSNEENQMYFGFFREKTEYAIISVVFVVMSIEGLINDYGNALLGEELFKKQEKNSIMDKIVDFYYQVTGDEFPKDGQMYQKIKDLIAVRNTLVHSKSIHMSIEDLMEINVEGEKGFMSNINNLLGNSKTKYSRQKQIEEVLENSYEVYGNLKKYLEKQPQ